MPTTKDSQSQKASQQDAYAKTGNSAGRSDETFRETPPAQTDKRGPEQRQQESAGSLEEAMAKQDQLAREGNEELTGSLATQEERAQAELDAQAEGQKQQQEQAEAQRND